MKSEMISLGERWPLDEDDFPSMFLSGGSTVKGGPGSGHHGHSGGEGGPGNPGGSTSSAEPDDPFDHKPDDTFVKEFLTTSLASLSDDQKRAQERYSGAYYRPINAVLRGGEFPWKNISRDEVEGYIETLSSAMTSLPENVLLYRGMDLPDEILDGLDVGDTLTDPGFMSTSSSLDQAARFTSPYSVGGKTPTFWEIRTPKGTQVLPISVWESEILLQRGGTLRVISKQLADADTFEGLGLRYSKGNVLWYIQAEVEYE